MKNLKVYFTSDLHGYMYPTDYVNKEEKSMGLMNMINQFQKDGNTLIIDAGDTIQGSPFTNYLSKNEFDIHPIATIMNEGKYDYITFGNHDFNYGYDYLNKYISNLDAKCLSANIVDKTNNMDIIPYDIKTLENGLKIGLIGITSDYVNTWEREDNICNFTVSDVFDSVLPIHNKLKEEVDVLIGIYHGGFEYDIESHKQLSTTSENIAYKLCKELEFDLLFTGHQHMEIGGQDLHGTFISQTPHNATKFVELNLSFDDNKVQNITSSLKEVVLNPNKKMYDEFLELENKVQHWLDTPVGFLDTKLQPTSHLDMALNGSNLANFINQIQLEESHADISCTSFANVIQGFNNNVTIRDVMSTYPYPNTLILKEVNRENLKLALERCASYFDVMENKEIRISDTFLKPKVEHYNYDYFANIEYTFDLSKEVGNRVVSIKYKGEELSDSTTLSLVMNNYRASGAGGYELYQECKTTKEIMVEMPEVIIEYILNNKNIVVDKSKYLTVLY